MWHAPDNRLHVSTPDETCDTMLVRFSRASEARTNLARARVDQKNWSMSTALPSGSLSVIDAGPTSPSARVCNPTP